MFCTNCGKEIPNGSKFCTSCGCKIDNIQGTSNTNIPVNNVQPNPAINNQANLKMVRLTVVRRKRFLGLAVPMRILVDGNQIASLKNDNSVDIDLPAGQHRLLIDTVGEVTDQIIELKPEYNRVVVTLIMTMGLVTGKAAIESIQNE